MTELHSPEVLYLCDGLQPCGASPSCKLANPDGDCEHTCDPKRARNGPCGYPQQHPERFKQTRADINGRVVFIEKELKYVDLMQ